MVDSKSTKQFAPDGTRIINPYDCWQPLIPDLVIVFLKRYSKDVDGGGPRPDGNCLDNDGRKGAVMEEKTVSCKWNCFHRSHCKIQKCCARV